MQYRNTPLKGTNTSPAQLLMGRNIRDSVPQPPSAYRVSEKWSQMLRQREKAMCRSNDKQIESTANRHTLEPLSVGTEVNVQNVDTNIWDRSGLVVEVCPFRQYKVKMHGSGRVSTRNRIHLRPIYVFKPVTGMRGAVRRTPQPSLPSTSSAADTTVRLSQAATPALLPSHTATTSASHSDSSSSQSSSYPPSSVDDSSYQSVRSLSLIHI